MNSDKNSIGKPMIINIVCALLIIIGAYFWFFGYVGKPGSTGLNQYTSWGLYIALFLFFEAVGAGALFIAAMYKGLKCRLQLAIAGTACVIGAGLAIMLDLGGIFTTWRLFFSPNFSSPILLDVWFVVLSVICGLYLSVSLSKGKESKVISILTAVFSVLLPLGTAILFTTLPGRIGWGSSLEIAAFLIQTALAGICFYIFLSKDYARISKFAASLFLINLIFVLAEMFLAFYQSSSESIPTLTLIRGEYAILYWLWIVVGLALPLVLSFKGKNPALTASIGLFGILISKFLLIVKGNMYPFLRAGEGVKIDLLNLGLNGYQKVPLYVPSIDEFLVSVAIFAFILVFYNLLNKVFSKTKVSSHAIYPVEGISE